MEFLDFKNISFYYEKDKLILKDFSFNLARNENLAILGQSGSGKSTILRLISGFEFPKKGEIILDSKDITFTPPEKRNIGILFQDYALFPHLSVFENIAFGLKKKDKNKALEFLDLIKMQEYKNAYPYSLSGGQQQRVALARALAVRPKLLLLDEPFSALDKELKSSIRASIKELLELTNTPSIIVTHDEEDARIFANKIVNLNN